MKSWLTPVKISFEHKDLVKSIPGAKWHAPTKQWLCPIDALPSLGRICKRWDIGLKIDQVQQAQSYPVQPEEFGGYPWQKLAAADALRLEHLPLHHEVGVGKTRTSIEALKKLQSPRTLIVCPALVRSVWRDELARWWPEHPQLGSIVAGRGRKQMSKAKRAALEEAHAAPIQVTSYALLDEVEGEFDVVILDESHRCKSPDSQQSKDVRCFTDYAKYVWELTGTLAADSPKDVWNQFDILWPGRFGSFWQFKERYCIAEDNGYGIKHSGLNPLYAEEFRERVTYVSSRVTKAEVADLLPPFLVQLIRVEPNRKVNTSVSAFADFKALQTELDAAMETKAELIPEWLEDTSSATHRCILTYHRETVNALTSRFCKDHNVFGLSGAMTPEARNEALARAKASPGALVIATMDSIGIGIDLTFCTQALMVELCYRPDVMLQALGRFSRLSSTVPSAVKILCVERTADELVASKLLSKIEAINAGVKAGDGEQRLQDALGSSNENWLVDLNSALEAA